MTATNLPFRYLEDITNGFSEDRRIGSGGFGEVYKGVDNKGGIIAVKKLYYMPGIDDTQQFRNELNNLMRVQHPNIVRFIGYCYEVHNETFEHNGEYIFGKNIYRVLCFEYLQNGSLDKYLSDESCGIDWCTRYKIIKGICEGLYYLHGRQKESIYHLDLKPANILLDANMVPKIADFGLSRLFGGSQTHITGKLIGTEGYMPPEYLEKHQISNKYDIFSLGVIIIQIIAGPKGFSKYGDMSSQEKFIELVHKNWRDRFGLEATSEVHASLEEDCQQVKRCIEIALRCVQEKRERRPTIRDIIDELKLTVTETSSSIASWKQVRIAKIGMWGGVRGNYCDIEVAPCRLESLIISVAKIIYSISFTYYDYTGRRHKVGPWGGHGQKDESKYLIELDQSEYLMEIHGTIGRFNTEPFGTITSLTLVTNARSYGPFGEETGTPFHIPTQDEGSIVGFFGCVGSYVHALGIYIKPKQDGTKEDEAGIIKIGPWGGNEGKAHEMEVLPRRLQSVTIHSNVIVNSLAFSYSDWSGHEHTIGPWGSPGGNAHTVHLGPSEFLVGFSGTTGPSTLANNADVISSLTLMSNVRSYGPFGEFGGTIFQVPMQNSGSIVGFFVRAGLHVNAIGGYANPQQEKIEQKAGVAKMGPWGGNGGGAHDIDAAVPPRRLESITLRSGEVVDSLAFTYTDHNGQHCAAGPWGGYGGSSTKIELGPSEFLAEVHFTIGPFVGHHSVITSLRFVTNTRSYGPFGEGRGARFQVPLHGDGSIVGFFGRSGDFLDALGFYFVPDV